MARARGPPAGHRTRRPRAAGAPGRVSRVRAALRVRRRESPRACAGARGRRWPRARRPRKVANVELDGTGPSTGIALDWINGDVRRILGRALEDQELTVEEGIRLTEARGRELHALTLVADEMRRRQAGDVVTYVVNRNINFTNVCIKHCTFCAFSRDHREEEGYLLPLAEVVRRAEEAASLGATEVCIQAGLPPKLDGRYYIDLTRAITAALPKLHLHAFSPEEVLYGATL